MDDIKYEPVPTGEPGVDYDPIEYVTPQQLGAKSPAEREQIKKQHEDFARTGKESPRPPKPMNQ